jgi:hypothetical protein
MWLPATHVDKQGGCSRYSLSLGRVGRSEEHYIASSTLHLEVYVCFYKAIRVSVIMLFKFDA